MQTAGIIIGILVMVVLVVVIIDVATNPPPAPQNRCSLDTNILLPDTCVCSKAGGRCTWLSTRPYLIFFTQAASCTTFCDIELP